MILNYCANCLKLLDKAARRSKKDNEKEDKAMEAGRHIAEGSDKCSDLLTIVNWKSHRRRELLCGNLPGELKIALDCARSESDVTGKIEALCKLKGVGVPMASAILTAMYPKEYTVIDVRALDTLEVRSPKKLEKIYPAYNAFCIETAKDLNMSLRAFDRAIWKAGTA